MPSCDFKHGLLQSRTKTRQIAYLDPPQPRPFVSFTEFQADPDHASFLPKRERAIRHVPNFIEVLGNQNLILESRRIKNETLPPWSAVGHHGDGFLLNREKAPGNSNLPVTEPSQSQSSDELYQFQRCDVHFLEDCGDLITANGKNRLMFLVPTRIRPSPMNVDYS